MLEVAQLADESCRNWIRAWREGNTFLRTQQMTAKHQDGTPRQGHRFYIGEIRPATEQYALVFVDHKQTTYHRQLGSRGWNDVPIYMVYSLVDNSCRETEHSAKAWETWPQVIPELQRADTSSGQNRIQAATPDSTTATSEAASSYQIYGPTVVDVGSRYEYHISGPANTEVYLRWYKDGNGKGGGSYKLDADGTNTAEWTFTETGKYAIRIYLSGAHSEESLATLSGIISSTP